MARVINSKSWFVWLRGFVTRAGPIQPLQGSNVVAPYKEQSIVRRENFYQFDWCNRTLQKPPYTDRLKYVRRTGKVVHHQDDETFSAMSNIYLSAEVPEMWNSLLLRCRDKLREKCGPSAMLAVNIAERKSSLDMITNRGTQFLRAYNALKKADFVSAARYLSVDPKSVNLEKVRWLHRKKRFGNAWLEYHFGWKPLISDIYNGVDVLQQPYPEKTVKARATDRLNLVYEDYWMDTILHDGKKYPYPYGSRIVTDYDMRVQLIADLRVENPSLYVANQLGLVNPALVAWELVPYSFLVDWFMPVGSFLSQFTDFCGMSLGQPMTTTSTKRKRLRFARKETVPGNPDYYQGHTVNSTEHFEFYREHGIYSAVLPMPTVPLGLSSTRAATAISLILQQLRR